VLACVRERERERLKSTAVSLLGNCLVDEEIAVQCHNNKKCNIDQWKYIHMTVIINK
jgi:hypothetical protein